MLAFGGPTGRFFAGGRLSSVSPDGLEVWDPADGARMAIVPGFCPTHHHRGAGGLVRPAGRELLRWSIRGTPGWLVDSFGAVRIVVSGEASHTE